jgi:hypothetical protein
MLDSACRGREDGLRHISRSSLALARESSSASEYERGGRVIICHTGVGADALAAHPSCGDTLGPFPADEDGGGSGRD